MVDSSSSVSNDSSSPSRSYDFSSSDSGSSDDSSFGSCTADLSTTDVIANEPSTEDRLKGDDNPVPTGLTGAAQGMAQSGKDIQIDNPILERQWESTRSAWTNKGGFTEGAIDKLESAGLTVADTTNPIPVGSRTPGNGYSAGQSTTYNGDLARDAIAERYQNAGFNVEVEAHYDANLNRVAGNARAAGDRFIDVAVDIPHESDPRLNTRLEIESKAFRVNAGSISPQQLAHDANAVSANRTLRAGGAALEKLGRVARPVGIVIDAVQIGSAYRADGNRIGENTARAATSLAAGAAGGWGGAVGGAAVGTAVFPGVGTVIGGIIGGVGGALLADSAASKAFDSVKNFFSW